MESGQQSAEYKATIQTIDALAVLVLYLALIFRLYCYTKVRVEYSQLEPADP